MTNSSPGTPVGISPYLDRQGRLARWPAKRSRQLVALHYVAESLESSRRYSEEDLNHELCLRHTWNDPATLRRAMIDAGILDRLPNGSEYWLRSLPPRSA